MHHNAVLRRKANALLAQSNANVKLVLVVLNRTKSHNNVINHVRNLVRSLVKKHRVKNLVSKKAEVIRHPLLHLLLLLHAVKALLQEVIAEVVLETNSDLPRNGMFRGLQSTVVF